MAYERIQNFLRSRDHLRDFSDLEDILLEDLEEPDAGFLAILDDPQVANALVAMQVLHYIRMVTAVLRGASPIGLAL